MVTSHPIAQDIGQAILDSGGNAVDAFVAVTAAESVLAEGANSLAGPLGVLVYTRSPTRVIYLDADFNDPLSLQWKWTHRMSPGKTILVPGAPVGLEALTLKYGTRPFHELLQPAIRLATEGFSVNRLMAAFLAWRAKVLKRTDYGRRTYFGSNGAPLKRGAKLRLPQVASFLTNLGRHGSAYVYSGDWAKRFLTVVREEHGVLTSKDLAQYSAHWEIPWSTDYSNVTLYSCSGRSYGGVWTLLALKTLEHASLPVHPHYSSDPASLELLVRVARQVWAESWILDHRLLDDRQLVESRLTRAYNEQIWTRVQRGESFRGIRRTGSHSYHIIVMDKHGNAASGTTTIESEPWGEGVFVQGIPLSPAGVIPWNTAAGERRLSPFSIHFALRNHELRYAVGAISNSVVEAAFQFLLNLIHYGLEVGDAVSKPRFGTFPLRRKLDTKKNWLDPRIDESVVKSVKRTGLTFQRTGTIDTGLGSVLAVEPGRLSGITAPVPYVVEPFSSGPNR